MKPVGAIVVGLLCLPALIGLGLVVRGQSASPFVDALEFGTGAIGSVSMWIAVVRSDARERAIASRNSSIVRTRMTSAPRLSALAARSIGSVVPSSRPVSGLRYRYAVPNRCEPTDSDSAPIEANPWFWTMTRLSLIPSDTAVTISLAIIRYEPSPTRAYTSRLGSAILIPTAPAISKPMQE